MKWIVVTLSSLLALSLIVLLFTSPQRASAQTNQRDIVIQQPNNQPDRSPRTVQASDQTLVAGAVEINSVNAALTLTDTGTSRTVALRNVGGDLFFGRIINPGRLPGPLGNVDLSAYSDGFVVKAEGNVGIGVREPPHRLSIRGGPVWTANGWKGAVALENASALAWEANAAGQRFGMGHTNGGFFFFRTASDPARSDRPAVYDLAIKDDGTVSVRTMEITGADVAENFAVSPTVSSRGGRRERTRAGYVVSIDPENPGGLIVSDRPYDRRVAGVISGAGGVGPGVLLGREMAVGQDRQPVALTGRVYCWADAAGAAIEPGDLLTTSSRPGHAMKVADHFRAQGAVLGKAMTGLGEGTGLVLVLVALQ